ncbi:MAG: hypothetical protein A3A86_04225 [Elusimicrobia bacterium RIFCSPLOWO2_01_FULL_60_11]|nr:MAG: hypothetical protein A3A86_04225 [Elusimicrobia bacterium RIFCSPLOWO2_01_FULL_60_11]
MNNGSKKVLIVSSHQPSIAEFIKIVAREDFEADIVQSGERALEKIWASPPKLLLLHLDLEGISGLDVVRVLRQDQRTRGLPIIAFSNQPNQAAILTAFNLEVDDYLSKPYHPEEVSARIKAVLNRRNPDFYQEGDVLKKGKVQLFLAPRRVVVDGKDVNLTPKEFSLLTILLKKEGRALSRSYLLDAVWNLSSDVTTRSVDMLVARLRKKLKKEGDMIETVSGYGYRIPAE